jgi:hypothetical protein
VLLSFDFNFYGLGFCVAPVVLDGQRVRCGFCGNDVYAAGVGRPDGIGLRLELHGFGVGYAVAELSGFAAVHGAWAGVEALDVEFFASKLIECGAIVFALFLGFCFRSLSVDLFIFLPSGKQNPAYGQAYDGQGE